MIALALIITLLLIYAGYRLAVMQQPAPQAGNRRQIHPGVFIRPHLARALQARQAVRGDDGYVRVVR